MMNFLYRLYGSDSELLYVGITTDPTTRFNDHRRLQPWGGEVARYEIETFSSWEDAAVEEQRQIAALCPRHNKHLGVQATPSRGKKPKFPSTHQPLPTEEVSYLLSLHDDESVLSRAKELYDDGWSVRQLLRGVRITPTSAWLVNNLWKGVTPTGHPLPEKPVTPTQKKIDQRKAEERYRMRTQLSDTESRELATLQQQSSSYRPTYGPSHPAALSRETFISRIKEYRERGVRIQEMADICGVSESNIRRRLKD